MESQRIFCRDAAGADRYWFYELDGERWRGHSGLCAEGSADVASGWKVCKPKNEGKKNARSASDQATFEASAEFDKKLAREYRRGTDELDSVPLAPMLAQKYKDLKTYLRFHPGGYVWSQPKLDGIRMLTDLRGGRSRDYQPFGDSVKHIIRASREALERYDVTLDGELYNHTFKDDFNRISSMVRTEHLSPEQLTDSRKFLQYHVYDLIPARGNPGFKDRQEYLREIAERCEFDLSPIVIVPSSPAEDQEQLDGLYEDYLARGYEGQMIRTNEPYEVGTRSWSLLKRKEFVDVEVRVTNILTGEGNWDGVPKMLEYDWNGLIGEDGRPPRAQIKGSMDYCRTLLGKSNLTATLRYFQLTPAGIPRFPVAVDIVQGERRD